MPDTSDRSDTATVRITTDSAWTYQFTITVVVEPGDDGYDDPEWIADAAWGARSNEYGYGCTYGTLVELPGPDSSNSSSEVTEP